MTAPDMLSVIQAAVYKARWVDNFGRESVIATDEAIARAVLAAISEAGTVEWGVLLGDLKQPHACKSEADARRDSECACCTLVSRIVGPWGAAP